ncbi:hypothetical protein M4D55_19880 [Metabacillus idriensis]|uniref:Helix-turn-helix domain-containing protein n=1 Tax=Metabacillus idriensis TaxID=324768 RepID=A0A6I2MEY7_9BACI|nr:hypothetical protein [Metabacillus idriensis]MCM3598027.1 hypothetical protein [Metabacillus idriensis]MRX56865.1 hypothetical protein [Metabacillus idriensis]
MNVKIDDNIDKVKEITLSPEAMKEMIDTLNVSIRQTALDIGISHSTLSRYIRKENKRQNFINKLRRDLEAS